MGFPQPAGIGENKPAQAFFPCRNISSFAWRMLSRAADIFLKANGLTLFLETRPLAHHSFATGELFSNN